MLLWAMILGTALGSTTLILVTGANRSMGLSDQLFVLGDSVILTVLGQVGFCKGLRMMMDYINYHNHPSSLDITRPSIHPLSEFLCGKLENLICVHVVASPTPGCW